MKRYNFDITRRKYQVNEFFFDEIDSEEKAYWLGFIYADGYVNTNGNKFGINLSLKDISRGRWL